MMLFSEYPIRFDLPKRSDLIRSTSFHSTFTCPVMKKNKRLICALIALVFLNATMVAMEPLQVSENGHYLVTSSGEAFFWLGDTAWLLPKKLSREEVEHYLEDRRQKEINVIQIMVLHNLAATENSYGIPALEDGDLNRIHTTPGKQPGEGDAYDYWDHLEYVVQLAQRKNLTIAMVPMWGSNVGAFDVQPESAESYGRWLGNRFAKYPNIIWLNGGDVVASDAIEVWDALAKGILSADPNHLMTFHPRGRLMSSMWFHDREWLDFNMFQSGHRRYDQDDSELCYGEDNWRYVASDWARKPAKPTLDGEPSYEGIPEGLHDTDQPLWSDDDVRRYAYWSVFAGGCGFTYGHNVIMQFHSKLQGIGAYGANTDWRDDLDAPGAWQLRFLKRLMQSRPMLERVPAQELLANHSGEKYHYLLATKGEGYAYIYTYMGSVIEVQMNLLEGSRTKASWFNPRNGSISEIGDFENEGTQLFDPKGEPDEGNDWVLILDSI